MNENPAENLMRQFRQCSSLFHRRRVHHKHSHEEGFAHRGQGRLLCLLLEKDGLSHKDIVEALDIRPSSVSELVARLEQSGQIQKSANEADKRVSNVYLTHEGRKTAQTLAETRQDEENGIFAALDQDEQNQLSALLGKLIASLREKDTLQDDEGQTGHKRGRGRHHGHDRQYR